MTLGEDVRDMGGVRALLATADPAQELVPCGISDVRIGQDVVNDVATAVTSVLRERSDGSPAGDVVVIVDGTAISRRGQDVKRLVEAQLAELFPVRTQVLDDGHAELHVSEDVVSAAELAAAGACAVVTVGGGTISDIGKLAADRAGVPVLVTVQTAASVDGYTDDVSVLLRDGVKRTVPSRWPDVVIADIETIAEAPPGMNRAGYGEMTSMFTAPADWRLANLVGADSSFHRGPIALLEAVGHDIDRWSPGLSRAELGSVERLTWALGIRGIATGVAGTTACLSGVEHLISHMLDLHHGYHQLPMGLHGAQVGVAAVVAAAAWELLFERMTHEGPTGITPSALDEELGRRRVEEAFSSLDPSGRIVAECWSDYSRKLETSYRQIDRLEKVIRSWGEHDPELRGLVFSPARIGSGLRAAGAAGAFGELEPSVGPELARWAVQNCALMRNRFTAVDLLTMLGWWTPADVSEVLDRAARSVAVPSTDAG